MRRSLYVRLCGQHLYSNWYAAIFRHDLLSALRAAMKTELVLHATLCAAALGICLSYPAPSRDVLLVQLGREPAGHVLLWQDPGSFSLMGSSAISGSLRVRFVHSPELLPMLRAGVLPIAVPNFLCSPDPAPE
jgi:hypothetical protein